MSDQWGKFLGELVKEVAPLAEAARTALQSAVQTGLANQQQSPASASIPPDEPVRSAPAAPIAQPRPTDETTPTAEPTAAGAAPAAQTAPVRGSAVAQGQDSVFIELHQLKDNPFQPRKELDPDELQALTHSIAATKGLLEPIGVRESAEGLQVIYGARRVAAFRRLHFNAQTKEDRERYARIPARVLKGVTDAQMALWAWVENVQRSNLSPLEAALGLIPIRELNGLKTSKQVATLTGVQHSRVQRLLRLAEAPEVVQEGVGKGICLPATDPDDDRPENERTNEERRTLDLMSALAFSQLHAHLLKKNGDRPDARQRADDKTGELIGRALKGSWSFRQVEHFVHQMLAGQDRERASRGRPKEPFRSSKQQLVIYPSRMAKLSPEQKKTLKNLLEPYWKLVCDAS